MFMEDTCGLIISILYFCSFDFLLPLEHLPLVSSVKLVHDILQIDKMNVLKLFTLVSELWPLDIFFVFFSSFKMWLYGVTFYCIEVIFNYSGISIKQPPIGNGPFWLFKRGGPYNYLT